MLLSLYNILNVKKTATKEEIELAYQIVINEYSLYELLDEANLSKIIQAKNILCDPRKREIYDFLGERIVEYLSTEYIDEIVIELLNYLNIYFFIWTCGLLILTFVLFPWIYFLEIKEILKYSSIILVPFICAILLTVYPFYRLIIFFDNNTSLESYRDIFTKPFHLFYRYCFIFILMMLSFDELIPEYYALFIFYKMETLPSIHDINSDEMPGNIASAKIYKKKILKFIKRISITAIFLKDFPPSLKWISGIVNISQKLNKTKIDKKYLSEILGIMIPYSITIFFLNVGYHRWYIFVPLIHVYYKIFYMLFEINTEIKNNIGTEDRPLSLQFNNS